MAHFRRVQWRLSDVPAAPPKHQLRSWSHKKKPQIFFVGNATTEIFSWILVRKLLRTDWQIREGSSPNALVCKQWSPSEAEEGREGTSTRWWQAVQLAWNLPLPEGFLVGEYRISFFKTVNPPLLWGRWDQTAQRPPGGALERTGGVGVDCGARLGLRTREGKEPLVSRGSKARGREAAVETGPYPWCFRGSWEGGTGYQHLLPPRRSCTLCKCPSSMCS